MFDLFRRNCLYNDSIEPHCAYCAHCKPDNEYQGVCEFRGIVAMAGSCRRFTYDALRRKPAKPARIRGRFTAEDFFFEENEPEPKKKAPQKDEKEKKEEHETQEERPLFTTDLSEFADLWEDDEDSSETAPENGDTSGQTDDNDGNTDTMSSDLEENAEENSSEPEEETHNV